MKYDLSDTEIELIKTALNTLRECREDEIHWACGDPDIVQCDMDDIERIDAIFDKIARTLP